MFRDGDTNEPSDDVGGRPASTAGAVAAVVVATAVVVVVGAVAVVAEAVDSLELETRSCEAHPAIAALHAIAMSIHLAKCTSERDRERPVDPRAVTTAAPFGGLSSTKESCALFPTFPTSIPSTLAGCSRARLGGDGDDSPPRSTRAGGCMGGQEPTSEP